MMMALPPGRANNFPRIRGYRLLYYEQCFWEKDSSLNEEAILKEFLDCLISLMVKLDMILISHIGPK